MNKTSRLIMTALMALPMCVSAQTSRLNFEDMEATTPYKTVSLDDGNGFKVVAESDQDKSAIDGNSINFAYSVDDEDAEWSPTKRWKPNTGLNKSGRSMTITVPSAGKLNVYVRNANGSDETRTITLTQSGTDLYSDVVKDAAAFNLTSNNAKCFPIVSVDVPAAGDITVVTSGGINFYGFAFTPTAATSVDVTITDAGYATFGNNTVGTLSIPEGVKAYGVSAVADGKVKFTEYNVIPAGVGVILEGAADTYTLEPTNTECSYTEDNLLVAVTADMTVPAKADGKINYIFANKEQGVGFYKSSGTGTITKGKAYLSITDESADNREWDFTAKKIWSDATIANLEVEREAATSWTTNAGDADAGWRYMYNVATTTEELKANGERIAELEGLFFRGNANRLGIDNRSTNRFYLAGNKFFVVIPDLKAGSTVTISTKSSSNSANAKVTCDSENVVAQEADDAVERDNVFTINAFGSYEFQPDRGLYITKITVSYDGSTPASARAFYAIDRDETTVISSVKESGTTDNGWYTLGGLRVASPTERGIYIKNGQKMLVK